MYGNLIIEMKKKKITQKNVADILGISFQSVCVKLNGKVDFTSTEMFKIKQKFFPNETLEYLFEEK